MTFGKVSVAVIGGGPAGISAAIAASYDGASVMLVEREKRLGGKLNQAIHDGFGFLRFDNAVTGPEYAFHDINALYQTNTVVLLQTSVLNIIRVEDSFQLTLSNRHGIVVVEAGSIVLACGAREHTPVEASLHGMRPAGVFTAGSAQYILNVMGQLPVKSCIMLGSNNLVLATARRLAQSGAKVLGVYEPGSTPKGYLYYISRCLYEYGIPLHLEHTITRVFGTQRLRGVELARTNKAGTHIRGSEKGVICDGFIMSGSLLPQNELALSLSVPICKRTNGPLCDQNRMTLVDGIFAAGSSHYISDMVDFISEDGEIAGRCAARHMPRQRELIEINASKDFLTISPQYIDCSMLYGHTVIHFNPSDTFIGGRVSVIVDNKEIFTQDYDCLRPSNTERIEVLLPDTITPQSSVAMRLERIALPPPTEEPADEDEDESDEEDDS